MPAHDLPASDQRPWGSLEMRVRPYSGTSTAVRRMLANAVASGQHAALFVAGEGHAGSIRRSLIKEGLGPDRVVVAPWGANLTGRAFDIAFIDAPFNRQSEEETRLAAFREWRDTFLRTRMTATGLILTWLRQWPTADEVTAMLSRNTSHRPMESA